MTYCRIDFNSFSSRKTIKLISLGLISLQTKSTIYLKDSTANSKLERTFWNIARCSLAPTVAMRQVNRFLFGFFERGPSIFFPCKTSQNILNFLSLSGRQRRLPTIQKQQSHTVGPAIFIRLVDHCHATATLLFHFVFWSECSQYFLPSSDYGGRKEASLLLFKW